MSIVETTLGSTEDVSLMRRLVSKTTVSVGPIEILFGRYRLEKETVSSREILSSRAKLESGAILSTGANVLSAMMVSVKPGLALTLTSSLRSRVDGEDRLSLLLESTSELDISSGILLSTIKELTSMLPTKLISEPSIVDSLVVSCSDTVTEPTAVLITVETSSGGVAVTLTDISGWFVALLRPGKSIIDVKSLITVEASRTESEDCSSTCVILELPASWEVTMKLLLAANPRLLLCTPDGSTDSRWVGRSSPGELVMTCSQASNTDLGSSDGIAETLIEGSFITLVDCSLSEGSPVCMGGSDEIVEIETCSDSPTTLSDGSKFRDVP